MAAPKFKRVCSGLYETADGQFELFRLEGVYPPAWNIQYGTDWAWEKVGEDPEHSEMSDYDIVVDGADSKRTALVIFAEMIERGEVTP